MKKAEDCFSDPDQAGTPADSGDGNSPLEAPPSKKRKANSSEVVESVNDGQAKASTLKAPPKRKVIQPSGGGGVGRMRLPEKLLKFLNDEPMPEVVWWMPDGNGFAYNVENVQTQFLDKHFRGTKLTSFVRSLNRWGFRRVFYHALPEHVIAFYHPKFKRDRPEWVKQISMCPLPKDQREADDDNETSQSEGIANIQQASAATAAPNHGDTNQSSFAAQIQGPSNAPQTGLAPPSSYGQHQIAMRGLQQGSAPPAPQEQQNLLSLAIHQQPQQPQQPQQQQQQQQHQAQTLFSGIDIASLAQLQLQLFLSSAQAQHHDANQQHHQQGQNQPQQTNHPSQQGATPPSHSQPLIQQHPQLMNQPQHFQQNLLPEQLQLLLMQSQQQSAQQQQTVQQPQQDGPAVSNTFLQLQSAIQFAQQGLAQAMLQQQQQQPQQSPQVNNSNEEGKSTSDKDSS